MKNRLFSVQYENFIFMYSYRIWKFNTYTRTHICGRILLAYIFVWRKVQKIWYFRETETYENQWKYDLFCRFHKFLSDENSFFMQWHLYLPISKQQHIMKHYSLIKSRSSFRNWFDEIHPEAPYRKKMTGTLMKIWH